jgi:hypothetical protein
MGIDQTKEPEKSQTIHINYPKLTVSGINTNNGDFISGTYFNNSSTPNITYTMKSIKNTYKAKELRIYGKLFPGISVSYNATLVIKNSKGTNSEDVYMCFLLNTNRISQPTEIDKILTAAQSSVEVNLNSTLNRGAGTDQYILYESKNFMGPCKVMIYTSPIRIVTPTDSFISTTDWFQDISSDKTATNAVVNSENAADQPWMVCENVDIDSDEMITSYNLPINSPILKEYGTADSFKTAIMFIVFFFVCMFSYLIVPPVYLMIIKKLVDRSKPMGMGEKDFIFYIDFILCFLLGGVAIILIGVGALSEPGSVQNQGDVLLSGFVIFIIFIISYIIIQSKKLTGSFIPRVDYVNDLSRGLNPGQLMGASYPGSSSYGSPYGSGSSYGSSSGSNLRMVPSQLSNPSRFSGGPGRM